MPDIKKFSETVPAKLMADAWADGFRCVTDKLQDDKGRITRKSVDQLEAVASPEERLFLDNVRHHLQARGASWKKRETLETAVVRKVRRELYKASGGANKKLSLFQVRKLSADLVEDGYALRGKTMPASVASDVEARLAQVDDKKKRPQAKAPAKAPAKATTSASPEPAAGPSVDLLTGEVTAPPAPAEKKPAPSAPFSEPTSTAPEGKSFSAPSTTAPVKDPEAAMVLSAPVSTTSTTVRFQLGGYEGQEIKPGERWLFEVPEAFRHTPIRTAVLAHRKASKYSHTYEGEHDKEGAYNLVTARKTGTDQWVTWSDKYGSKKFAERRSAGDPENENLHDWVAAVGEQSVDMLSVQNVGKGENAVANVHMLEIEFFPPGKPAGALEEIFTPGTEFADLSKGKNKPRFGGGLGSSLGAETLKTKGLYPDSVEIGGYGYYGSEKVASDSSYVSSGRLRIKLPAGKRIGSVEIACGDTAFSKHQPAEMQRNKDGHYGKLGWAKLYGRLRNSQTGEKSKDFMVNVNVPPSGVLSGGLTDPNYVTKPGDEIEIESQGHETWVMGYKIQFIE